MSRAVFLPSTLEPYIDQLWLKNFEMWQDEIDRLYVYFNGDIEKPVVDFLIRKFEKNPKIKVIYHKGMTQHGSALAELTRLATEEYVMWIEEDGYILQKGTVDGHFKMIESGAVDVIGSPRVSSSMDLQQYVSKKYNVDISGTGDKGVGLWPNFFFAKRSDLMRTDMNFNAIRWVKGQYIKEIDWTVEPENGNDIRTDTFVWGAIQLRALGLKIKEVRQFHAFPYWEGDYRSHTNVFSPDANWIHVGSLSGSLNGILTDDGGNPLSTRELNRTPLPSGWKLPDYCNSEAERKEFQRRCAFYLMAYRMFEVESKEIEEFGKLYLKAVNRVIDQYRLDKQDIEQQIQVYSHLLKL